MALPPQILHAFPNEPLAPEDFEDAMDDLRSASARLRRAKTPDRENSPWPGSQLSQLTLHFSPFDGDAA